MKDIPRGSFPFDMVLLGNELAIYEDIQSTSKQSRGLQGFKQIHGAEPRGRLRATGRYTKPTSREAEHKPSSSNGRYTKRLLGSSTRSVSGVGSSTKPRACDPQMEADLDGYNYSTETGKY